MNIYYYSLIDNFFLYVLVEDCFKSGNYDGGSYGKDIDVLEHINDAESCQRVCQTSDECLVWTYDQASKKCYRQSGPAPLGTCTTCTHGPKFCPGVPMPPNCVLCSCDPLGSVNNACDVKTGKCPCNPNVVGDECNECGPEMWGSVDDCQGMNFVGGIVTYLHVLKLTDIPHKHYTIKINAPEMATY